MRGAGVTGSRGRGIGIGTASVCGGPSPPRTPLPGVGRGLSRLPSVRLRSVRACVYVRPRGGGGGLSRKSLVFSAGFCCPPECVLERHKNKNETKRNKTKQPGRGRERLVGELLRSRPPSPLIPSGARLLASSLTTPTPRPPPPPLPRLGGPSLSWFRLYPALARFPYPRSRAPGPLIPELPLS